MSSKSGKASKTATAESNAERTLQKKHDVPVQLTDLAIFDDNFAMLRERFMAEMKRVEDEMKIFSANLARFYNQPISMQAGITTSNESQQNWDEIANSPLVQGEGENKTLKLQFDVSQFLPAEVQVKVLNNILTISANHEEKSDRSMLNKQYNREFLLPPGTNAEAVISSVSRDGILIVQVPLPSMVMAHSPVQKVAS